MDKDTLSKLMDAYGNIAYKKDLVAMEKKKLVDSILTDEIKIKLAEIDAEFLDKETSLAEEEKKLKKAADKASDEYASTLAIGNDKIKFESELMELSIYEAEPVWDVKGIDGYAIAGHPEILSFRTVGKPKTRLVRKK